MLKTYLRIAVGFFSLLGATHSLASGGMSGGGAGLVLDKNNPWFLDNTKEVRYCIEVGSEVFSATETMHQMIDKALAYWKDEYAHATVPQISDAIRPVKIATQTFLNVPCNEFYDMRFQFGVLHPEQKPDFIHPQEFAGAAIRTSYDRKAMRAMGYVYIAPDRGPNRFKGAPNIKDFWSYGEGGLLYRTLVHELGHVFGLSHSEDSVMSESYVEEMMAKTEYLSYYASLLDPQPFFKYSAKSRGNTGIQSARPLEQKTLNFFKLDAQTYGLFLSASTLNKLLVKSSGKTFQLTDIGEITLDRSGKKTFRNAQSIYLPDGNEVYKLPAEWPTPWPKPRALPGPFIQSEVRHGVYRSLDRKVQKEVIVEVGTIGPTGIGAVINGRYEMNLLFSFEIGENGAQPLRRSPTL